MRAISILSALCLAGCGDNAPITKSEAYDIAADAARQHAGSLEDRIQEIEKRLADTEEKAEAAREASATNTKLAGAVAEQVKNNADAANANSVKEMTRRGACGTTLTRDKNGTYYNRKNECTEADLVD